MAAKNLYIRKTSNEQVPPGGMAKQKKEKKKPLT